MPLTSPMFADNARLQAAALNQPPMMYGEKGVAVERVQMALVQLGYPMPKSRTHDGFFDGVFGDEMLQKVREFQGKQPIGTDGKVGRQTLERLDAQLQNFFPAPEPKLPNDYIVPGQKLLIAQTTSMTCWAYAYTMLVNWKRGTGLAARNAIAKVGPGWVNRFDHDQGLPPADAEDFFRAAGLKFAPLVSLTPRGWVSLLQQRGLLWVGAANQPGNASSGLHVRVVEGFKGDGSTDGGALRIMDPAGAKRYTEDLATFTAKFEAAMQPFQRNYQIVHF